MRQFLYTRHAQPVLLDCNFIVDSTAGAGVTNLNGPGIQAVYMHSSSPSALNPNPANGYVVVQFQDTYAQYFLGMNSRMTRLSGSSILVASAGVTANTTYVITVVGTTTTAGWQSLGLPIGITPAVGVSFVASATTTAAGTGAVQVPHVNGSGVAYMEEVGNGSLTLYPTGIQRGYPYLIARFMAATNSSTTTPIATAPADTTLVRMGFLMGNSSVQVAGG